MKVAKKTLGLALGGAFAATVTIAPASAAENPFVLKPLASGYMVADNHEGGDKMQEGKCGSGNCGGSMKMKKSAAGTKTKEGNCSAEMKDKEGNCSSEMKAMSESKVKEGNCGAEKKMKEGNCSGGKM